MPKIALQLHSLHDLCQRDFAGTLKQVKDMGYSGVEFAGFHGCPAAVIRELLAAAGLDCSSAHIPIEDLLPENLEKTLAFHIALGNSRIIVPWLAEMYRSTLAACQCTVSLFNAAVPQITSAHLHLGYHNHEFEFQMLEGRYLLDRLLSGFDPAIFFQPDIGNAAKAGIDLSPWLEHDANRISTIHIKEWSALSENALIGEGQVPWGSMLSQCRTNNKLEWYVLEQNRLPENALEQARINYLQFIKLNPLVR